jgi:hypothetical protein
VLQWALRQPALQQRALQQPALQQRALLLWNRKRSWKQPGEQPGGQNISFDFPLRTILKPTPEIGLGLEIQPTRGILANRQQKTTNY